MLFIPGKLISLVTFPGIIVHEIGHLAMCKVANVKVYEYSLLRWSEPMGYVVHDKPESLFKSFLITFGPFFANTLVAVLLGIIAGLASYLSPILGIVLLWLTISVGMHAFPSFKDAESLLDHTAEEIRKKNYLAIAYLPFVLLICIGGAMSFFWADFLYAILLLGLVLSSFNLPLFYNLSDNFSTEITSGGAKIIGCSLYMDGNFLGETTKEQREIRLSKKSVESGDAHTFKCEFVGCRQWKIDKQEITLSQKLNLDWDKGEFIDCETNTHLDQNMVELYKKIEDAYTEKTRG